MSEPYDVSTPEDKAKGNQRLVDRMGNVTLIMPTYRIEYGEKVAKQVYVGDFRPLSTVDDKDATDV